MKRCLVVDDSSTVRKVIARIVRNLGFEIVEAENGEVARQLILESSVDVILLDWNMPVMDGLSFLRWLRGDGGNAETKVVFCTTVNELSDIEAALCAGADEYIMKPFDESLIRDKLEQIGVL